MKDEIPFPFFIRSACPVEISMNEIQMSITSQTDTSFIYVFRYCPLARLLPSKGQVAMMMWNRLFGFV